MALNYVPNYKVIGMLETQVWCFEIWDRNIYITKYFMDSSYTERSI